jgi:hypothetical protein
MKSVPETRLRNLIGLYSSTPQSGKSEVAKVLTTSGFHTVKFADPLKTMVRGLLLSMGIEFETVERMVEGDLKEEVVPGFTTVTPRHLMQTLGTDWGREAVDNELWTKVAGAKMDKVTRLGGLVVVDDLRFPNEYDAMRERGAYLVRVVRPGAQQPAGGSSRYEGLLDDHEFDVTIVNDGTLPTLHAKAFDALVEVGA